MISVETGASLPGVARAAVEERLRNQEPAPLPKPSDDAPLVATFVTITKGGKLRGCMGTTVPRRTLLLDVQAQAVTAAFRDPRFPKVEQEELGDFCRSSPTVQFCTTGPEFFQLVQFSRLKSPVFS